MAPAKERSLLRTILYVLQKKLLMILPRQDLTMHLTGKHLVFN
jgi:hypothetical protein